MIMYYEVHKQWRGGFKPAQISRKLGLDRRTVRKYLAMSEQEYLDFIHNQSSREKLLVPYEEFVKTRLENCEEASAAQVHDWLKEHHEDFVDVDAKTVFNFVLHVRTKYGIPKPFNHRDYEKVEELPYGKQTQADFGEYNMTTEEGKRKKIYFLSFVLSRSRQKISWYSERPFTTISAIDAHEKAFQFFEGITEVVVYDQDTLFLVDENKGDLIMTEAFRKYAEYRGFKLHFCRKSDPQSKGKVENVVKYNKYNFLRGRIFVNIDILNGQNIAWHKRTANAELDNQGYAMVMTVPPNVRYAEKFVRLATGNRRNRGFDERKRCGPVIKGKRDVLDGQHRFGYIIIMNYNLYPALSLD